VLARRPAVVVEHVALHAHGRALDLLAGRGVDHDEEPPFAGGNLPPEDPEAVAQVGVRLHARLIGQDPRPLEVGVLVRQDGRGHDRGHALVATDLRRQVPGERPRPREVDREHAQPPRRERHRHEGAPVGPPAAGREVELEVEAPGFAHGVAQHVEPLLGEIPQVADPPGRVVHGQRVDGLDLGPPQARVQHERQLTGRSPATAGPTGEGDGRAIRPRPRLPRRRAWLVPDRNDRRERGMRPGA
jgi:hypothetical protein